jgi:hypothetical protein
MARVVFPDCVADEDAMTIVNYVVRGQIGIVRDDMATICARYHAAGAFKAKYGGADAENLENLDIDVRLGCELVVYLRHYWLIAARVNRPRLAPTPAFVGQDFGTEHSTELSKILQRCHMGLVTCLRDSTADVVSKNLNALLSGCLCWGSLAEVVDPRAYSQFEKAYFEPMKPFGAMVELSEVFVKLVDSIYTSARTRAQDEILRDFKDDHEVYGLTGLEQPLSFRVLPPFEYQGKKYRGAVWIGAPRHCFGKYCDISGKMSEEDSAQVRDSAPPPPSQVFYKIRDFLERCGASVPNSSFNAVCYESALFAHLRIHAPEIIDVMHHHVAGHDVAAKTVPAMICWNESGQTEVIGHWAFITKRPGSTDEPMIISTNDHFLSRDMRLFEEKIGDLFAGEAQGDFNRHVGAVLRNFVTRVDASEHRQDATGERENVFIGSRWSDAERKHQLPHMAIRAAALVSVLASASGASSSWHRAFDDIEYVRSRRSAKKEYEMYEERFSAQLVSPVLLERWAPRMFTRAGVVERLLENDRRQIAYGERQHLDPLTMWPLCYFIFFGVPHSPLREPKRERHMVDLQASEADEANMALM